MALEERTDMEWLSDLLHHLEGEVRLVKAQVGEKSWNRIEVGVPGMRCRGRSLEEAVKLARQKIGG